MSIIIEIHKFLLQRWISSKETVYTKGYELDCKISELLRALAWRT